jgi:hypothetical protein
LHEDETEYIEMENILSESTRFGGFRAGFRSLLSVIVDSLCKSSNALQKLGTIENRLTLSLPSGILENTDGRKLDSNERFVAALKATVAGVKEPLNGVEKTPLDGKDVLFDVKMCGQVDGHPGFLKETETIAVAQA